MTAPSNLVIILSDQHNPRVMGCAGHPVVQTPNLDALAQRGTRFASAYTNCPICVPARASLATGRYVHQIRFWDNAIAYDGSVPSWGHRLMARGRRVTSIGKLHYVSSDPARNGFSEEILPMHLADGDGDVVGLIRDELIVRKGAAKLGPEAGPGESHYTAYDRAIADEACKWLRQAPSRNNAPWVLYVGFVCPHPPLIAPQQFFDLYAKADITMPEMYAEDERPRHPYLDFMRRARPYDAGFTGPDMVKRALAAYFGSVSFLDHNVGRVLSALNETGLAASTRVLYSSDHGENLGARGFWAKSTLFEESAGIPMILSGPDIPENRVVGNPVSLVDVFPTVLECAGVEASTADADLPGASLIAAARGELPQRTVLSEYHAVGSPSGSFMIRRGRYKYIHYCGYAPMLFDLESDPYERHDLASHPELQRELAACETQLRAVVDIDAVEELARADQRAMIERLGGKEAIMKRGAVRHSPPPGVAATRIPVERE
ncbi:MAG TPA: sulfatase-like hydrolase/transferase [Burkholderiales bacterium]|nr:sulfatase-like hydrolase/transferase [Burkholderiales bacterium]